MERTLSSVQENRLTLAEMVRRYYADVFRFCSRELGAQLAEDATQETFMIAAQRYGSFRGDSSEKTWLFGIAINIIRNYRRRARTLPLVDWEYAESASTGNVEDRLISAQALRKALAELSPQHREVVLLHEVEGLTYEECAQALRIPVGTVKSRLYYAFKALRELLKEEI
ncbi:MAG: RNA polymerase sigma factor [Candidatus Caldarchaeum sp.]